MYGEHMSDPAHQDFHFPSGSDNGLFGSDGQELVVKGDRAQEHRDVSMWSGDDCDFVNGKMADAITLAAMGEAIAGAAYERDAIYADRQLLARIGDELAALERLAQAGISKTILNNKLSEIASSLPGVRIVEIGRPLLDRAIRDASRSEAQAA